MRTIEPAFAAVGVVLQFAAGCRGTDRAADLPVGDFCASQVEIICAARESCGCFEGEEERAACEVETMGSCLYYLEQILGGGRIVYDQSAGEACIDGIRKSAEGCGQYRSWVGLFYSFEDCEPVFAGTVPRGEACGSDLECQSGSSCIEGTCAWTPEAGDPCPPDWDCRGDLYCADGLCAVPASRGEACDWPLRCADSLYCDDLTHECAVPVGDGGSCASDAFSCEDLLFCDDASTCVGALPVGSPCRDGPMCLSGRCDSEGVCASNFESFCGR